MYAFLHRSIFTWICAIKYICMYASASMHLHVLIYRYTYLFSLFLFLHLYIHTHRHTIYAPKSEPANAEMVPSCYLVLRCLDSIESSWILVGMPWWGLMRGFNLKMWMTKHPIPTWMIWWINHSLQSLASDWWPLQKLGWPADFTGWTPQNSAQKKCEAAEFQSSLFYSGFGVLDGVVPSKQNCI